MLFRSLGQTLGTQGDRKRDRGILRAAIKRGRGEEKNKKFGVYQTEFTWNRSKEVVLKCDISNPPFVLITLHLPALISVKLYFPSSILSSSPPPSLPSSLPYSAYHLLLYLHPLIPFHPLILPSLCPLIPSSFLHPLPPSFHPPIFVHTAEVSSGAMVILTDRLAG